MQSWSATQGNVAGQSGAWLRVLAFQAYRASGIRERDLDIYLEAMELWFDAIQQGFPDALKASAEAHKHLDQRLSSGLGRLAICTRMLRPAIEGGIEKDAVQAARLRCTQVALAIENFREDHQGARPETTDELTPKYLYKLPTDPFDASPLVYERLPEKGYRVIAVTASKLRKRPAKNQTDLGITVNR
jgi:hypothetical protein